MEKNRDSDDLLKSAQAVVLIGYSIFTAMHIIITFLLGWEKWVLIPILAGLLASWAIHVTQSFSYKQRLYLTAAFMMCTYFVYGIHTTSTFDLAVVMASIMMLFIMTRVKQVITICQVTYYFTMTWDLVTLGMAGVHFGVLEICRILMNYSVITMIAGFVRMIMNRWNQVMEASDSEIEKLTDAAKRLNDFLANVSHEIRTPVNAVIGLSGICIEKEKNDEIKEDLLAIRSAGRRVAEQIGDILDFSEMDKGNLVANCEDYLITSVVNDLIPEFREMKKEGTELVINLDPRVPAVMHTDVVKLKKIIKALVANGLKFTEQGGVYLELSAEPQAYGVNLKITVADTGIGMSEEEIERVYDRFYQTDSGITRNSGGLGLGLGIVSGFVSLLGGFMVIESKIDKGTTVRVSLPQRVISNAACMSLTKPKESTICTLMNFDRYKNAMVREFYELELKTLMSGLGAELYKAENAAALEKITDNMELKLLIVGEEEYRKNREQIERLARCIQVALVTEPGYECQGRSFVRVVEKPFYCLPLVVMLNSDDTENDHEGERMYTEGVRALIVDDERMNLVVAKSILERYKMQVLTAASGPDAIDLCRETNFDLIFMDHMMSGMDGVEAMKRIRSDVKGKNRDIPMIALTANAMSSAKQMFMDEGFDGFVSKPIELVELERVIKRLLPKDAITYGNEKEEAGAENKKAKAAETNPSRTAEEVMEFAPAEDTGDVIEFAPAEDAGDAMEFAPTDVESDVFEFAPAEDTKTGAQTIDAVIKRLTDEGIDAQTAMSFCADDAELYAKILFDFALKMNERVEKLEQFFDTKDIKNYEINIHATKSTLRMVGVQPLSEKALALEEAARREDAGFIKENHGQMMESLKALAEQIIRIAGSREQAEAFAGGEDDAS